MSKRDPSKISSFFVASLLHHSYILITGLYFKKTCDDLGIRNLDDL